MDKNYIKRTEENYFRSNSGMWRHSSPLAEKQLSSQTLYKGRIIELKLDDVELPDGARSQREYVTHPGGAAVLPIDEDGFTYLVEQYRYPYREAMLEIPAGKLERGEDPLVAAARELEEETGLKSEQMQLMGILYPTPGYTDEKLYIYVAEGLKYVGEHPDCDEFLHVIRMPFHRAWVKVMCGEISDAKTCFALLKQEYFMRQRAGN